MPWVIAKMQFGGYTARRVGRLQIITPTPVITFFIMNFRETIWHKYLRRPYRLHVQDYGGDGPIIIFLHGIAASSASWDGLIPMLAGRYRCISIDLMGFGKSPKPQWYGYTMNDHMRAVNAAIRGLRLKQPFILAGHSLGSLLATRYAALWPEKIDRVLLLSPPVYPPIDSIDSVVARKRNQFLLKIYRFLHTYPSSTPENIKRLNYLLPVPRSVFKSPETWLPFRRTLENCIERQTIIEDIVDIRAPIDIFYSSLDPLMVPYNIRQLKKLRTVTIHPIRGTNHLIGRSYAAAVATFLTTS